MADYFARCTTEAGVRSAHRRLALKHHPDRGGSEAAMREVNAQYVAALARVNDNLEAALRAKLTPGQSARTKIKASRGDGRVSISVESTAELGPEFLQALFAAGRRDT